jgi:hypothetical protein
VKGQRFISSTLALIMCAMLGMWMGDAHPELSVEPVPVEPPTKTWFEDGSWTSTDGTSGCIEGRECDDSAEPVVEYRPCVDEYEDTECVYTQGGTSWYVDERGDVEVLP